MTTMLKNVSGQDRAVAILCNAIKNNTLSHSYIFFGPEGVGKRLTAVEFAKTLNCIKSGGDECEGCASCHKIDNGIHPDVSVIEPDGEWIKINQIKHIQKIIQYRPYEGKKKVIIINNADNMLNEAANAFLKTLEEPPDSTILILICVNPQSLLPTIVSRCQAVRFNSLSYSLIKDIIKEKLSLNEEDARIAAALSDGSLERAFNLDIEESGKLKDKAVETLVNPSVDNIEFILNNAKEISNLDRDVLYKFFGYLLFLVRDMAVLKNGASSSVINKWAAPQLQSLVAAVSDMSIHTIFTTIMRIRNAVKKNANAQMAMEVMMFRIADIRAGNV